MIFQTIKKGSGVILLVSRVALSDVDTEMVFGGQGEASYPTSVTGKGRPRRQLSAAKAHHEGIESRTQTDDHMLFPLPVAEGQALA